MEKILQRLRSKTYWAAIVMAGISVVEANAQFISQYLPAEARPYLLLAWPLLMITLREVTTGALADK